MIKCLIVAILVLTPAANAEAGDCESQVQVAAERALQDLPEGNMKKGLQAFTQMHLTGGRVTVIAAEKKGRNAQDDDAEELSKRVGAYLDAASPFYLGVGDTGQDFKVPRASAMGRLIQDPEFLRKFFEELESPDFDGLGTMALSIKVKASFVRNYLLSEKKIEEHEAIPIFIDTTPDTVMRQGFYAILNDRGVTFPKTIQNLEKLALEWQRHIPVHFVIRANLMVIQPFVHSNEVSMDFAPEPPMGIWPGYRALKKPHYDEVKTYGASSSLYILAIPQPLKPR